MTPELEAQIMTQKKFTKLIEEKVTNTPNLMYLDAVVILCGQLGLDESEIAPLISKMVKSKIQAEAIKLKLLKGGGGRLPI
jgi:hypothetical protein